MSNDDLSFWIDQRRTKQSVVDLQLVSIPRIYRGIVTTTNATPTTILTIGTVSDTAALISCEVIAHRTDTAGECAGYRRTLRAKNIGGTVTLGTVDSDYTGEDDANWDVTFSVSTTSILIKVTGAVGKTIDWALRATIETVQPYNVWSDR